MTKKTWLITQAQIKNIDIDGAILSVDPEQIPDHEVFGLHGAVRLRIESACGIADVIGNPAARKFFRALHVRWPWAAFFLRLQPITATSTTDQVVDLAVFMALALVHVDNLTFAETPQGVAMRYDAHQLRIHLIELQSRAAQLAEAVDLPPTAISQRDALISEAVTSFFAAGQAFNQPTKNTRKKKQ